MTKKEFKELCNFHVYTGYDGVKKTKHNVIYFDYKRDENVNGYKFAVALDIVYGTKAELIKQLYNWVFNDTPVDWFVRYKLAETDEKRFKPSLSLGW